MIRSATHTIYYAHDIARDEQRVATTGEDTI